MTTEARRADAAPAGNTDSQTMPQPRLRAVVSGREVLSPGRVRLSFRGADVAVFMRLEAARAPGAWIKLFVPCPHAGMVGRAYTLRNIHPDKGSFDVDFILHESGPLSSWARSAQAGESARVAAIRLLLHEKWQLARPHIRAMGYWKRGAAHFRPGGRAA